MGRCQDSRFIYLFPWYCVASVPYGPTNHSSTRDCVGDGGAMRGMKYQNVKLHEHPASCTQSSRVVTLCSDGHCVGWLLICRVGLVWDLSERHSN